MTHHQIMARKRELDRFVRDGNDAGAEAIAIELAAYPEPLYDQLDDRGISLSWECDR
jgi:hypothetical protein